MGNPARMRIRRHKAPPKTPRPLRRRHGRGHRLLTVAAIVAGVLVVLIAATGILVDRPLRGYMERRLNSSLKGYTAHLRAVDFHLIGFGLDLEDLTILHDAAPEPPVLVIPRLAASVQWTKLLFGTLVADFRIDRPRVHLERRQAALENADAVPLQSRGWQDAFRSIYPLEMNEVTMRDCEFTWIEPDNPRPLVLTHVNCSAKNIRNIESRKQSYPSALHLEGIVFDTGRIRLDGHADFLAKPHPGVQCGIELQQLVLDYLRSTLAHYHLDVRKGTLSVRGQVEYAAEAKRFDLESLQLDGAEIDFVRGANVAPRVDTATAVATPGEKPAEGAAAATAKDTPRAAAAAAQRAVRDVHTQIHVGQIEFHDGTFGFADRTTDPHYRLFVSDTELELSDYDNQRTEGRSKARLRGKFMGGGAARIDAAFGNQREGPDFDASVAIEPTALTSLNDLLRAHGNFDVVAGEFSLYSEVKVHDGGIQGYIKPLFKDPDVYDKKQERHDSALHKIYEGVAGGIATLLRNQPKKEVATVVDLSGRLDDPKTSTLQAVGGLIRNAFFEAILPGFERSLKH